MKRIGFWAGLVVFVLLVWLPPPRSMEVAVRVQFAGELKADAAHILTARGEGNVEPESPAWRRAEAEAVQARARTMLAAAAVTLMVACWWITVALPIPVTSLVPLAVFPLVGVLPLREAALPYANDNVFLFMGGFIVALGLEKWGLHRRIALHVVRIIGTGRSTIVLGFMVASAVISMWISNTATTMMMLPIALAVVAALPELSGSTGGGNGGNFGIALMLGVAYAASIGGIATPIGTPPNLVFRGQLASLFPGAPEISFAHWMLLFLPLVALFIPATWLVLCRVTCRFPVGRAGAGREVVQRHLARLGGLRGPERLMLVVFAATALLWMTRSIPLGGEANVGWSALLEKALSAPDGKPGLFHAGYIGDATVAMVMAILLFILPAGRDERGGRRFLMDWETALRLPWGILLLFGGGFAIADGFRASGLSLWCGQALTGLDVHSPWALVPLVCLLMTFLTEITSNTATTQVMLPIVAKVGQTFGVHPLLLMLPATISASCAFMLPVATPPNAIVFGSGLVPMSRMVRTGLILNFVGVLLVTAVLYLIAAPMLNLSPAELPTWAK